jgi:molybdopterin biosynthesis enzyme
LPSKKKGDDRYVAELRSCFNDVLARMEQDEVVRAKIDDYAMHYEDQRGPIFSNKLALQNIEAKSPRKSISIMYVCVAV